MKQKISVIGILICFLFITACTSNHVQNPSPTFKPTKSQTSKTINTSTATVEPTKTNIPTATVYSEPTDKAITITTAPSKTPTSTIASTSTPEFLPTPVHPLEAHEWEPETVLASLEHRGGDGCHQYPRLPEIILYSDGQLFINTFTGQYIQLLTKQLERQEICAFLNTVDQLGYFDYDETTYQIDRFGRQIQDFSVEGSNTQSISVNAWRSKSVSLYGLWTYVTSEHFLSDKTEDSPFQDPTILPAIKNTFLFLSNYLPDGMEVYQSEAIEVWVMNVEIPGDDTKTWQIEDPSLEYIINNSIADDRYTSCFFPYESSRKLILMGSTAQQVYEEFSLSLQSQVFTDGANTVELFVMPVLPNTDDNESAYAPTIISCTPDDGLILWNP